MHLDRNWEACKYNTNPIGCCVRTLEVFLALEMGLWYKQHDNSYPAFIMLLQNSKVHIQHAGRTRRCFILLYIWSKSVTCHHVIGWKLSQKMIMGKLNQAGPRIQSNMNVHHSLFQFSTKCYVKISVIFKSLCTRSGHPMVIFSGPTWTNAHCLVMLCRKATII